MIINYYFYFKSPIQVDDQWAVPFMGGKIDFIRDDGAIVGVKISFKGQPTNYSPDIIESQEPGIKASITDRDKLLPFVRRALYNSAIFIKCYFEIEISKKEITIEYIGETEEEEKKIKIKSRSIRKDPITFPLPFDIIARSFMAAEHKDPPALEAALLSSARSAFLEERFIDSFRYSFLLIEAIFGEGKFKTRELQDKLKSHVLLTDLVRDSVDFFKTERKLKGSEIELLIMNDVTPEEILDYLVKMRGYYFHSNTKHKNPWHPDEQDDAEAISSFAIHIALGISSKSAREIFDEIYLEKYVEDAKIEGAAIKMTIKYKVRKLGENTDRDKSIEISTTGTKITPRMAIFVAKKFLSHIENTEPDSFLISATCETEAQRVFEMRFHVK